MGETGKKGWLARRVQNAIQSAFTRAYETVRVDAHSYLANLRAAHDLPVVTYRGMYSVPIDQLDEIANGVVRASMKLAAVEGAGFGLGGFLTVVPDLSILAAITMRMIQKLSLVYGFEYNTDEEVAELWVAAASAAGVDISRELVEREVLKRFVPAVIRRIAANASAEVVEKWAARAIPVASSAIGGTLNYFFIRAWGERASRHFREKHLRMRLPMHVQEAKEVPPVLLPPSSASTPQTQK